VHLPLVGPGPDNASRKHVREEVFAFVTALGLTPRTAQGVSRFANDCADDVFATLEEIQGAPACSKGCSYCCHQIVGVRVDEAVSIANFLRAMLTAEDLAQAIADIEAKVERVRGLLVDDYVRQQIPCAFLGADGACSIYRARPLACRAWHSLDAAECKNVFDCAAGANTVPVSIDRLANGGAIRSGVVDALAATKAPPTKSYEIHAAVLIALQEATAAERWCRGDDAFASALIPKQMIRGLNGKPQEYGD
jgi:hypothetical protein